MRRCGDGGRRLLGAALALLGVLIVFLCLPMEFLLTALGVGLVVTGLVLLSE